MDGVEGREVGDAVDAAAALQWGDLVAFKSKGEHGDRGYLLQVDPKVLVLCLDGAIVDADAGDLAVADRTWLRPGNVVAAASDPGGQLGVVTRVDTALDLARMGGGCAGEVVARGVSPADVRRVRGLAVGDYVVSGPWLGRVVEVDVDVDVLFDDGAVCRVADPTDKLAEVTNDMAGAGRTVRTYTNVFFYPGQRVAAAVGSEGAFRSARWLHGSFRDGRREAGTVVKVGMTGALVYWVASARLGAKRELVQASAPPACQPNPRNLTFFCSVETSFWAVTDNCFFRTAAGDAHAGDADASNPTGDNQDPSSSSAAAAAAGTGDRDAPSDTVHEPTAPTAPAPGREYRKQLRKMFFKRDKRRRREARTAAPRPELERTMCVVDTRTTVDVLWQDGTRRRGVASASLVPFHTLNDNEFFPGYRVVDLARSSDGDGDGGVPPGAAEKDATATAADAAAPATRVGVVRSLNSKDQTVRVSWLKPAAGGEVERDETVSLYDLGKDSDYNAFYGNIVVRLRRTESAGDGGRSTDAPSLAQGDEEATSDRDGDLSWVGHVTDLCDDGRVQVKWGDGNTSKVSRHEIEFIEEQALYEIQDEMGEWLQEGAVEEEEDDDDVHEEPAADDGGDDDEDVAVAGRTPGRVGAVVQALARLAGGVLAAGKRFLVGVSSSATATMAQATETNNVEGSSNDDGHDETTVGATPAAVCGEGGGVDGGGSTGREEKPAAADGAGGDDDDSDHFPQFDVVQSPPDHHFLDDKEDTGAAKKWIKRVQREWKILENNLPETIYVRAFEDRMDLLRAAMVGAAGTPYHDGLFFFDLQLPPSSFPASPPLVHYRSFGLRVNPNLYTSGTVCLSLLGTFDAGDGGGGGNGAGASSEHWSPAASSVLQVVVSLQGLVLTAQPYYNEAGYEAQLGTPAGARNALPYAENAYLLTLRSALHLLRRPPPAFEPLVAAHFRRRGRFVLRACDAYLRRGCAVGTLDADAGGGERACSAGFRLALAAVAPRLVEAFTEVGAGGCEEFDWLRDPRGAGGEVAPPCTALDATTTH
ncbi:hypothetical protein ACP4OV_006709 [Aristida adscensionis]